MKIKQTLNGIVKGHRFQVPQGIRQMNERVKESHRSSPWAGNRPGVWANDPNPDYEDYGDCDGEE